MATLPPEQTADDKLAGLLERLARCRVAGDPERGQAYADARRLVEAQIALLPLVHGIDRIEHVAQVVADRELRSRTRLGRLPSATEAYLGLADQVYTAAGVLYCSKIAAIALSPAAEESAEVWATPWDTGAFCKHLCPELPAPPDPRRREVVEENSLPAPQYRRYLAAYVASCFDSTAEYLKNTAFRWPDPLGALSENWLSRIFEVRLRGGVRLDTSTVAAVFLPSRLGGRAGLALRYALTSTPRLSPEIQYYAESHRLLREQVCSWILDRVSGPRATAS